jgi:N-methylhydantoinase B
VIEPERPHPVRYRTPWPKPPGSRGAHAFEVGDKAEHIKYAGGECYEYHYGGGGGWGDPLDGPPERVLDDVPDEYVSVEGARRDYGVVLTGSLEDLTLAVDARATEQLRAEMRSRGR